MVDRGGEKTVLKTTSRPGAEARTVTERKEGKSAFNRKGEYLSARSAGKVNHLLLRGASYKKKRENGSCGPQEGKNWYTERGDEYYGSHSENKADVQKARGGVPKDGLLLPLMGDADGDVDAKISRGVRCLLIQKETLN